METIEQKAPDEKQFGKFRFYQTAAASFSKLFVIRTNISPANEVFDNAPAHPEHFIATVYNSLRFLKGEGLVGEVRFGNDATGTTKKAFAATTMPSAMNAENLSIWN